MHESLIQVVASIIAAVYAVIGLFGGTGFGDSVDKYKEDVSKVAYENDFETAIPQTEIYDLVTEFFKGADNGKKKKAIVIGYDGCRVDVLAQMGATERSGIKTVVEEGGHLLISYCGATNYPLINKQQTSTAPGWCSMLCGCWADVHGIDANSIVKSNDHLTMLTTLVEDKTIDSSAFYVSWGGHFTADDSTYYDEKAYTEEKGIDVTFGKADDDDGTYELVMNDVTSKDCSDFIFSIFEYCDHIGHDSGFCPRNPEQKKAFLDNDKAAVEIINAIKERPTYANEDWLIILTSDHGGVNTGHGGPTIQERYTFIACNKDI